MITFLLTIDAVHEIIKPNTFAPRQVTSPAANIETTTRNYEADKDLFSGGYCNIIFIPFH